MDCSLPCLCVTHYLPESAQVYVHCIGDAIQPSHPLMPSSPALNLSQHQGFFQWFVSSQQMTKIQELQLQHQWSIPLHFSEYSGLISLKNDYDSNKNNNSALITGDCPGTLVAKTLCSQCRGGRFDPWPGNCIPHASAKNPACHNLDLMQPNKWIEIKCLGLPWPSKFKTSSFQCWSSGSIFEHLRRDMNGNLRFKEGK